MIEATVRFLELQARAGVDALMLFDSWASAVPAHARDHVVFLIKQIIDQLANGIRQPVIGPRVLGRLVRYCELSGVRAVGIDHGTDIRWAAQHLPEDIVLQAISTP